MCRIKPPLKFGDVSFRSFLEIGNIGKKFVLELHVKVQFDNAVCLKLRVQVLVLWLLWPARFPAVPQAVPLCPPLACAQLSCACLSLL